MSLKLFPYKIESESAKRLARTLGILRVSPSYKAKREDIIINWGNSNPPHFKFISHDLNDPHAIGRASDKLRTFQELEDCEFFDIPYYTDDINQARDWIDEGHKIYCRTTVTGHSGHGIVIADQQNEIVNAPLYTVATRHKHEYRVHVFRDQILDVQQKKKKLGYGTGNGIRNHSNGWVYARAEIAPTEELLLSARRAVQLLGLDFGAVDIGHRLIDNQFFVFEVNTAPGLEGTTLDKYAKAIYNYYRSII